jgi:hypothetical protein
MEGEFVYIVLRQGAHELVHAGYAVKGVLCREPLYRRNNASDVDYLALPDCATSAIPSHIECGSELFRPSQHQHCPAGI